MLRKEFAALQARARARRADPRVARRRPRPTPDARPPDGHREARPRHSPWSAPGCRCRRRPGCWPTGWPPRPTTALRGRGVEPEVEVVELREHARDLADHLVTGFPNGRAARRARRGHRRRRPDRGDADLRRVLQRAVQDVLRRPRARTRSPASRCCSAATGGHRPALAGPRPRAAAAVRLPARGRRCRPACSPRPRTGPAARAWPSASTGRPASWPTCVAGRAATAPARPVRRLVPFEALLRADGL